MLQASTETSLKFASLVQFIDAGHINPKEILDAVLYLVSSTHPFFTGTRVRPQDGQVGRAVLVTAEHHTG